MSSEVSLRWLKKRLSIGYGLSLGIDLGFVLVQFFDCMALVSDSILILSWFLHQLWLWSWLLVHVLNWLVLVFIWCLSFNLFHLILGVCVGPGHGLDLVSVLVLVFFQGGLIIWEITIFLEHHFQHFQLFQSTSGQNYLIFTEQIKDGQILLKTILNNKMLRYHAFKESILFSGIF